MVNNSVIAPFIERRAKARMNCNYPASLQGHNGSGKKYIEEGKVVNMSRSGIFMLLNRAIPDGDKVSIRIAMPTGYLEFGSSKLATCGMVARSEPRPDGGFGVAIRFEHYRIL